MLMSWPFRKRCTSVHSVMNHKMVRDCNGSCSSDRPFTRDSLNKKALNPSCVSQTLSSVIHLYHFSSAILSISVMSMALSSAPRTAKGNDS